MALLKVAFVLMLYNLCNKRIQKYPCRTYDNHIGYPASSAASKDIVRKIDFVVTYNTAHNHNKVTEKVKKISYEN